MSCPHHEPGSRDSWLQEEGSWADPVGARRRAAVDGTRTKQLALAAHSNPQSHLTPHPWWINEQVDKEAIEVGYQMLETIAPTGPPDRDRAALAALAALTAINDSYAAGHHYGDVFDRFLFGHTVHQWLRIAFATAADWEHHAMETALRVQVDTLASQRVDRGIAGVADQLRLNVDNYREYLRWRDAEGCFYGVMLLCAVAAGIDLRSIPAPRVRESLEIGIVAFDLHSGIRHRSEDETADIYRYLPGTRREKVDTGLGLIRDLQLDLIHADDLADREKEFLLRYATAGTLLSYVPLRWARTTALHIVPDDWIEQGWSHVTGAESHAIGYSMVTKPDSD